MSIGEKLKALRGNLSQREAANRIGMKQPLWRIYEADKSKPGADLIIKICETFGCDADWLLGLERQKGRIVATNSAVVIGSGTAVNGNAEPGEAALCRKCEIKKKLERIKKLAN